MAEVFFRASRDALSNITYAFDFVHPVTISLKYLRNLVNRLDIPDQCSTYEMIKTLIDPDTTVHGVNYKRSFIDQTWKEQEERIAWLLLNNLFAIYEGWTCRLYTDIFADGGYEEKSFEKMLQFPESSNRIIENDKSKVMENAFYEIYRNSSGLDFDKLDNYLLCYRYFKEARNCFMHRNFITSDKVVDAYKKYEKIATKEELDISEVLITIKPVLNETLKLNLRGVIGFSQIISRIIRIWDSYMLCLKPAEKEFLDRKPESWTTHTLNSNVDIAKEQTMSYALKAGFKKPKWSIDYQNFLLDNKLFCLKK